MKSLPLSLIIVAFLFAACGSKPKHTPTMPIPTDTPVPPTPTPLSRPPDGTYTTSITREELTEAGIDELLVCENAGVFALTLTADRWDIVQTSAPGCTVQNPEYGGSLKYSGDQVTFHEDEPFGCSSDYTYQWAFTGSGVRLTSVDDNACPQRAYYMSTHIWVKER